VIKGDSFTYFTPGYFHDDPADEVVYEFFLMGY